MRRSSALLAGLVALPIWLASASGARPAASPSPAGPLAQNVDLLIYDPSGAKLLGRAHYTVAQHDESVTIDGHNTYLDGEYDVEHDTLRSINGGSPRMLTYEHNFFDGRGVPQIASRADMVSGSSSCAVYKNGKGEIKTADLEFPPDTYAGAGVLVPIAYQLRRGLTNDVDIHFFDCADGPRVLTLHADLARASWPARPHDGELAKADASPVFGWFNVFLKPFVPKTRLWFDPLRNFAFVGGTLSRYYRGPEVLLVGVAPPAVEPGFERPRPPVIAAPPTLSPQGSTAPAASSSAARPASGAPDSARAPAMSAESDASRAAPGVAAAGALLPH